MIFSIGRIYKMHNLRRQHIDVDSNQVKRSLFTYVFTFTVTKLIDLLRKT